MLSRVFSNWFLKNGTIFTLFQMLPKIFYSRPKSTTTLLIINYTTNLTSDMTKRIL